MFTSRAELLEKGETTAQHKENRQEEAEKLEADKTNTHPRTGGLFQGSFKERPPVHRPIYDVEDNVNRCPICQWELEDTGCHHCGYGLDVETLTDSEENSEMTDYIDDLEDGFGDLDEDLVWNDIYHGVPFDELPFGLQQFHGGRPRMPPHHHHHHHHHPLLPEAYATLIAPSISTASRDDSGSEDEDEDEDDFGEMDSFIDDDEVDDDESDSDRSTVVGDHDYTAHPLDDFEDEGSDVPMSQDAEDVDDYYDEDSSEDEDPIRPPVTGNSRRTVQSGSARPISGSRLRRRSSLRDAGVDTNGSSRFFREDTADRNTRLEQQQQRASRPVSVGLSVDNAIPVDDDSDDDDAPVRPTRRNRRTATRNNQQLDIY
ncbi:E3 ubiquitin ligase [Paecilomyces lecythidis]